MSDPERLRDTLDDGFERSLLEAAAHVAASPTARRQALHGALGAIGGVGAATGVQAAAHGVHAAVQGAHAAGGSSAIAAGVLKAFAIGLVSGAVVAGGAVGVQELVRHDAAPAHSAPASPRHVAPQRIVRQHAPRVPAQSVAPPPSAAPAPHRAMQPVVTPSASAASPSTRLAQEVAVLDRARTRLSGGDARGALAALDDYVVRFPHGAFGPEATVLRIEALARAGERARAAALARSFLKHHPGGPLAERARLHVKP